MAKEIDIFLGKNNIGGGYKINLNKAPHVLIGGTTGSGKSNLLHCILLQLLSNQNADLVDIYIGDPKKVEFFEYEKLRQVKMVANNVAEHDYMLKHLCDMMDERYQIMQNRGIKNVVGYKEFNNIVVIVDEFGDLVLDKLCGSRITTSLIRLVQLGRAAGINVILATQHPTSATVHTTIKANCPTRIALKVSTNVNSRVILDRSGAENLSGSGKMIVLSPYDSNGTAEIQAPYIDDVTLKNQIRNYFKRESVNKNVFINY